jgi:hypothetical protein
MGVQMLRSQAPFPDAVVPNIGQCEFRNQGDSFKWKLMEATICVSNALHTVYFHAFVIQT